MFYDQAVRIMYVSVYEVTSPISYPGHKLLNLLNHNQVNTHAVVTEPHGLRYLNHRMRKGENVGPVYRGR